MATHSLVAAVETSPPDPKSCSVKILSANSKAVTVHYATMPDNTPQTNHDKFYVWQQNDPRIPYGGKILATFDFSRDEQEGSVTLKPLSLGTDKTYCMGLAVGPDPKNTVAACFVKFPAGGGSPILGPVVETFFTFGSASSDSVRVELHTLNGYKGKTWGAVARLFEGEVAPLSEGTKLGETTIDSDNTQNQVNFDGLSLAAGYNYTVGFYTSAADDQWTTLAAAITFQI